jgi:hypothetical protein
MDEVFVVTKQVSIDTSIIGVARSELEAKEMCHTDYENDDKEMTVSFYTFSNFEISQLYTRTTYISYDYIPNEQGEWSEIKVQRFYNYEEFYEAEDEISDNG